MDGRPRVWMHTHNVIDNEKRDSSWAQHKKKKKRHVNKYYSWFTAAGHRWRKINI